MEAHPQLTLNFGIRFDQMYQFVDANQWSPRATGLQALRRHELHAGYARYFTPPSQVLAGPTNVAPSTTHAGVRNLRRRSRRQPPCGLVLPERSHYFDVGITQRIFPGLEVGVDGYYKIARDLLDDGQFGAALVSTASTMPRPLTRASSSRPPTLRQSQGLRQHRDRAAEGDGHRLQPVSDQARRSRLHRRPLHLHRPLADGNRVGGLSYLRHQTRLSADLIYGSGLRTDAPDVPNGSHVPGYTQVNFGCRTSSMPAWPPRPSASTSSTCSTRSTRSATARHRRLRAAVRPAPRIPGRAITEVLMEVGVAGSAERQCDVRMCPRRPTTAPKPWCRRGSGRAARASSGRRRTSPSWPTRAADPRPAARRTR